MPTLRYKNTLTLTQSFRASARNRWVLLSSFSKREIEAWEILCLAWEGKGAPLPPSFRLDGADQLGQDGSRCVCTGPGTAAPHLS